jgi:hypothetical protein
VHPSFSTLASIDAGKTTLIGRPYTGQDPAQILGHGVPRQIERDFAGQGKDLY